MCLRRIVSRTMSAQFCAASSSALEFASPAMFSARFDPPAMLPCVFCRNLVLLGVLLRRDVVFRFPRFVFSVSSLVLSFLSVCVVICAVLLRCLVLSSVCFFFPLKFRFFRFPLSGNFDIFLGDTRAPRARDRDGGDGRAGKTAKFR